MTDAGRCEQCRGDYFVFFAWLTFGLNDSSARCHEIFRFADPMRNVTFIFLAVLLWTCSGEREEQCVFQPEVSIHDVPLAFERFEDSLANISSKRELIAFLTRQPLIRDEMLRRAEYPNDSIFIDEMFQRFTNPGIDTLLAETKKVFGNGEGLEREFREAFAHLQYYYPDFTPPRIKTVITGLDTDLYVTDSLIVVSLDFFLGPDARFRPKTYDYLMRRYDPHDIVPSCMLIYGISPEFNKTDLKDRTVLADMIAYGKSFYFAKHMIPCVPDSTLIWYTREEIQGAAANEDLIWARFLQDQVLFSTSAIEKKNYLGDRPITIQVGEKCPGRIGQWIGWQVVKEYMAEHADTSLPELMKTSDAQTLFKNSGYRPQNN